MKTGVVEMDMERLAQIFEAVKVLPLRPTDILVFRTKGQIRPEVGERITAHLKGVLGHQKILVVSDDADLEIIRPEAATAA